MTKITMYYKGRGWNLDEYECRTMLVENKEEHFVFARYKEHSFLEPSLKEIRGRLEVIFDEELKKIEGVNGN